MREILFRAKKYEKSVFDETDWMYGSLIDSGNHDQVFIYPWLNGASTMPVRQLVYARMETVNPETVGQFTGLFDKNGKRIFEGDIVRSSGGILWLVAFEKNSFVCKDNSMRTYFALWEQWEYNWKSKEDISPSYNFEVVGNIYDNPELMG
jgi:uncharacterized phage protein (TIGR01671 family)